MSEDSNGDSSGTAGSGGNRRLLAFAVLSQLAAWTGVALFIPTIPLYLRHLNATDVEIGQYVAVTMVSLSFGPMLIGWLSDRLHLRDRLVVLCYALQTPIAYFMGTTDSLVIACLLNVGLWTFGASSINLTRAIVALNFPARDRDHAFARPARGAGRHPEARLRGFRSSSAGTDQQLRLGHRAVRAGEFG